jgi:hypothetical protein
MLAEQLRRWWIKVTNIEVTTLYETCDPFIQIIIGGSLQKELVKITKDVILTRTVGDVGMVFKSDVLEKMVKNEKRGFQCELEAELRASYAEIEQEIFHLELWAFQGCSLNVLKGYTSRPLLDIARGDIDLVFDIKTRIDKMETLYARVVMRCIFQEIWDFYLTFRDWRTTELIPEKRKKKPPETPAFDPDMDEELLEEMGQLQEEDLEDWMDQEPTVKPMLKFTLNDKRKRSVYTNQIEGKEPYWNNITGGIHYRGTVGELNQETMTLTLYNYENGKEKIGIKVVSLGYFR